MSKELQIAYSASGDTLYAVVRNAVGQAWNTSGTPAFETYSTAHLGNYAIAMTEQGSSAYYAGNLPALAAGVYFAAIYVRAGGSPAEGDTLAGTQQKIEWDGSAVIPLYSRLAPLVAGTEINVTADGNVILGSGSFRFMAGNGTAVVTQVANTRIRMLMGGEFFQLFTHAVNLNYTGTGTGHTGTIMKSATSSVATAAVAAAGTTVTSRDALLDGNGSAIAMNDVVCVLLDNGTWLLTTVASVSGNAITLNDAVPAGRTVPKGTKVLCYGLASDTLHARQQYAFAASSATNVPSSGNPFSLCKGSAIGEPLVFDSNNATNAGTVNYANWAYTQD